MSANSAPLLEMSGIEKSFPGVRALRRGALDLRAGEIHALLGENGAGKSTLIRILSGALAPDAGSIRLEGRPVRISSPHRARELGIAVIHQEFHLVPALTIRENLFLGREHHRAGWLRPGSEAAATRAILERLGLPLDPETPCRDLSVAEQQLVEIAKAVSQEARILVMDEPTAALTDREVDHLFTLARDLRSRGLALLYVSHRLDEIFTLCDRATILRDGEHIATAPVPGLDRRQLIEWMVGRPLEAEFPPRTPAIGSPCLEVRNLRRGRAVRDVSFHLRRGEILGLTGLVGAGRTETARLLFGADPADGGEILLEGRAITVRSPRDAIRHGICLLTEDRKQQGLVLGLSARENFGLPNLSRFSRCGLLRRSAEQRAFQGFVDSLRIRLASPAQPVRTLSGGNQQKIVLAKWLQTDSRIILCDEPTRGVDVGAKFEIYQLINQLAAAGKAVLLISSELPEILGLCDRILVMREGRISGEITDVARTTQADILSLATH